MKKLLIIPLLLCIGLFASPHASAVDLAAPYVDLGMTNLQNQDLVDAYSNFEVGVTVEPSDGPANVLLAATRLLLLPQTTAGSNFLNQLAFPASGRDIYAWTSFPPTNSSGKPQFPAGYNSSTAIAFYTNTAIPLIQASLANLANVTDTSFQLFLPNAVATGGNVGGDGITLDYGDVQMLRALLTTAEFAGYTLSANNSYVTLSQLETAIQNKTLTIQSLFSTYSSLAVMQNTSALADSESAGTNAIEIYFGASDFIRNDRTDTNALFNLLPEDAGKEAKFRTELTNILESLTAPTQFDPNNADSVVYLGAYFSGTNSLRKFVPQFNGDAYVPNSLPNYTFGGILPDFPPYETESLLLQQFPNYAGIYEGTFYDSYYDSGNFAVYISTNGQLTVVGNDPGSQNDYPFTTDGTAFGILVQTNLEHGGSWQYSNSVFNAYGNVDKGGQFSGEIDYNNGVSVYLNAYADSPLGPFQSFAGYYTGSYSGSQSGALYSIVPPDGYIYFTTGQSGPGQNDGGWSEFYNSDNDFEMIEPDGLDIYGILNTNSVSVEGTNNYTTSQGSGGDSFYNVDSVGAGLIVGIYTNYFSNGRGTFSLSRSSKVLFNAPPMITTDLPPYLTIALGSTTTFRLGVSGSSPLSYQWYFNGDPIPGATSGALVVSNNLWTSTGTYSISATVANVAGATNSQVCSVTVASTLPPVANDAGFYLGQYGVSDSDSYYGGFVAYVSTNGQVTVVGQDNGDGNPNDNNSFGIYFQAGMDAGGDFQYNGAYFSAYGNVNSTGMFYAQLYYPQANNGSGEWVYLNGNLEAPQGPFQNPDGLYTGSYTGANSGTVNVILDPNGNIYLVPLSPSADGNPYGNAGTGASGAFFSDTQFSITSVDGTIVGGTLNPNTFVIVGGYTNLDTSYGTFAVSRSSKVLIPVPPTITTDLPATLTLPLGNLATFRVGASGSQPLSYQWYFNGNPIAGAVTNTLVVSNNLWTTTGTYGIWATVANVAGSSNSQVCAVTIVTETNIPTVAITSPLSGQVWSNSLFSVTGTAGDKVGITGVVCVVNGTLVSVSPNPTYSNWLALVQLTPGNNTISAYSINDGFIQSKTATVLMDYVATSPLTVVTNGNGMISPNDNGLLLRVGANYTLTATPAAGFIFTNWSTGLLGSPTTVYTNKSTVIFTMETNLVVQANFVDTLKPYLKITNPIATPFLITNAPSFTMMGVATDDEAIASVNYSFNKGAYTTATTTGTQWSAPLSLMAGTNFVSVYAQATNGNLSVTDTVEIVMLSPNPLTVVTNGRGLITPANYTNGVLLDPGVNYSITATPAPGFIFTNWSTGLLGSPTTVYTNKSTLAFTMETNLVVQANFVDTLKPYLKITSPISTPFLITNAPTFTMMGVATDDEAIATVDYSFNKGAYTAATTDGMQWSTAPLALMAGTNFVSVYAQATNGNLSVTDTVEIVMLSPNPLTVVTNGRGSITPVNYTNGVLLDPGVNYTITTTPAPGFIFTNWSTGLLGSPTTVYTNKSTLAFTMETNLVVQANFVDTLKPYLKITNPIATPFLITNAPIFTMMGVATDDEAIASVDYSFNKGAYTAATTNGMQWSTAPLALMAGTNFVSVYAQATNGNLSVTDTVVIVMLSPNPLAVVTNGRGLITPANYTNGVMLDPGVNYSITATPAAGFIFTNWSTGLLGSPTTVYTNKSTLAFTMETNLVVQANFVDTLKPYLKITNPIATPFLITNAPTFTMMGVATDDEAIASVDYSFNKGAYTAATTNGIQWSTAPLSLMAGTNFVSVYAQATNGNLSVTDTVEIVMLSPNPLTVVTNGRGSITPVNYTNGVMLDPGVNYSITATPATGFIFTNWSTGLLGSPTAVYTNKSTLAFTMETNLVVQANFVDTLKPYLKITNPIATPFLITNAPTFTMMGVATDDEAIATVDYSFNKGAYTAATTNGIQWSTAPLSLMAGTNFVSVYAQATNGNLSVTDTVEIVMLSPNPLTVVTNGRGLITPANYTNGVLLNPGVNYSITATPAAGFIFTNWSTGLLDSPTTVYTNKSTLAFTMETNLVVQANFVDTLKPYLKITNPIATPFLITNAPTFTMMGVATDDEAIASVDYSFNKGAYTAATTNGVQWSTAPLSLMAGTNFVSVYAQATNGNLSVTDTVEIVMLSPNPLTVVTNGRGLITPANYTNGVMLDPGVNYSITATPATGFIFTNWSTGLLGSPTTVYTNKSTLAFTMETNLVVQANFVDTLKPYLKITNPISTPFLITNASFAVMGVATDDEAVASVNYSLNGGTYMAATTNGIQWTASTATLPEGTNTFAVYALATNGNTSATNTITIIRYPTIITFLIATNPAITHPQAQVAYDGANYLVVFQENGAKGQFVSPSGTLIGQLLTLNPAGSDDPPYLNFDGTNYLVAWADYSDQQAGVPIRGALVSPAGTAGPVLTLSESTTVDNFGTMAFGGGSYFLLWSDDRTTPDSVYGALINPAGTNWSGDFLISTNGKEDEAAGPAAAFDGTNFLAVWSSATNKLTVSGQFISPSGALVNNPFLIYTNTTSAGTTLPSVTYDGTNYLVLFNIGVNSSTASGYHILGRFVTTGGTVLTNQITLTADAGPQIAAGADSDGINYLASWNQGWNPFVIGTSGTINGRFLNAQGTPTTVEFPVLPASPGLTMTWAPVFFDGTKFVLVGGLGKLVTPAPDMQFTNGAIYGAFVSP